MFSGMSYFNSKSVVLSAPKCWFSLRLISTSYTFGKQLFFSASLEGFKLAFSYLKDKSFVEVIEICRNASHSQKIELHHQKNGVYFIIVFFLTRF